jgi:hypothetical protein
MRTRHTPALCSAAVPLSALISLFCLMPVGTISAQEGGPSFPPLSSETPMYKCHVAKVDGSETVIYFYEYAALPERFADVETLEQASVPDSVRTRLTTLFECVRLPEDFSEARARELEDTVPQ